jgi:hypothetical protein
MQIFHVRTVPVYLALGALGLAAWTGAEASATSMIPLGWAVAGMVALYVASAMIQRAGRPEPSGMHAIADAARVNAGRVAAPQAEHPAPRR